MDGKAPETEYSRMLDEAVKKVKRNETRRTAWIKQDLNMWNRRT